MPRLEQPQMGRPRGSTSRRFAMYFLGVAIGLVLVGLMLQMKHLLLSQQRGGEAGTVPAETAP